MLNLEDIRKFFDGEITPYNFIAYIFGLTFVDIDVLQFMMKKGEEFTVNDIMLGLNKNDGMHISKVLRKLIKVGIAQRSKTSVDGKPGYFYSYTLLDVEQFKQLILDRIDEWYNSIRPQVTIFEEFFAKES